MQQRSIARSTLGLSILIIGALSATIALAQARANRLAKQVPNEAPWTAKKAAQWDNRSVGEWLKHTGIRTQIARDLFDMAVRGLFTGDLHDVSFLNLLFLAAEPGLRVLPAPLILFGVGTGMYQASLWAGTFEVVSPAARATAIGLLNVASGVLSSWWNPLIGSYRDRGGDLGSALAFLALPAAAAAALLLINVLFLLPRDYRGPLRKDEG